MASKDAVTQVGNRSQFWVPSNNSHFSQVKKTFILTACLIYHNLTLRKGFRETNTGLPKVPLMTPLCSFYFCIYGTWIPTLASAWEVPQIVYGKVRPIHLSLLSLWLPSLFLRRILPFPNKQDSLKFPSAWLNVRQISFWLNTLKPPTS